MKTGKYKFDYNYTNDDVKKHCSKVVSFSVRTYRGLEMAVRNCGISVGFDDLKNAIEYRRGDIMVRHPQWVSDGELIVDISEMFLGFGVIGECLGCNISFRYLKLQEIILLVKDKTNVCFIAEEYYDEKLSPHVWHIGGLMTMQALCDVEKYERVDMKEFIAFRVNNPFGFSDKVVSESECIGGLLPADVVEEKVIRNSSGNYACLVVEKSTI